MEAPNIQLYQLFQHDLHLTDAKSLELMHLLDKEYKSSVKEDIAALGREMNQGFQKVDARFDKIDARFEKIDARFEKVDDRFGKVDARFGKIDARLDAHDKRFDALDTKIEIKSIELQKKIDESQVELTRWMIGIVIAILLLFIGAWFKK